MRKYLTYLLSTTVILMIAASLPAQQAADTTLPALRYESMTRNELMKLTYDDLLLIPLEDLLKICERLGVNMDDLLKLKTRNGSFETLTPRENPSMLSVITDEEIQNSGARNLADVLRMVPGYHVAYDIDGAMGLSTRGMWSMEGKILILVDGLEMNDLVYNSAEIGDRFNISEIKRIEIIRGPGSSIYGGSAELGVINIITKSGSDLNGISVSANYGRMERMTGRRTVNFAAGEKRNDVEYSLTGQLGDGTRSDGLWQNNFKIPPVVNDFKEGGAGFKNQNIHANLKFKDLEIKYIYNNYITDFTDSSDYYNDRFLNHSAEIKYTKKLSDKLSMIPRINVSYSEGYNTPDWETLRGVNRTQVSDNFKYDIRCV